MTGTTIRAAAALALLAAVSATPRASAADDAVPPPKPPTLRLAAGTTYVFRYIQDATLTVRSKELSLPGVAFAAGDDGSTGARTNLRVTWEVGLKLVEVRPDESIVVNLLPARASGVATFGTATAAPPGVNVEGIPSKRFDSDDVDGPAPSPFVGRALVVRLAGDARVLEATPAPLAPGAEVFGRRITPADALEFAQRFFQELPTAPPLAKTSWDSRRGLAPELGYITVQRVALGDVVETASVERCDAKVVSATIRGKSAPATAASGAVDPSAASPWRTKVLESEVTGDVVISRTTGLARSRTTRVVVKAHRDGIQLKGGAFDEPGLIPRRVEFPKSVPAQDETYEIETRLELVEPR